MPAKQSNRDEAPSRMVRGGLGLGLLGVVCLLIYLGVLAVVGDSDRALASGDFGTHYRAGSDFARHRNLYYLDFGAESTFKSAPVLALALSSLSWLPIQAARLVWYLVDVCLLGAIFFVSYRAVYPDGGWTIRRGWILLGTFAIVYPYVRCQLAAGQPTTLWVLLCMLAFLALRDGKSGRAGFALATAVCVKVVPLCFVPHLLLRPHKARNLAGFGLGVLCVLTLPALWLGWQETLALTSRWLHHFHGNIRPEMIYEDRNQSLLAVLHNTLSDSPFGLRIAHFDMAAIKAIWLCVNCVLAALMYGWFATLLRRADGEWSGVEGRSNVHREAAMLSMSLIFMTVCNPLGWKHNCVALILPYLFLLDSVATSKRDATRRVQLVLLVISAFLVVVRRWMVGDVLCRAINLMGGRFWGEVALAAGVFIACKAAARKSGSRRIRPTQRD